MSEYKIFGTDGIRGVANKFPLTPSDLVRLGQAIAKCFLTDSNRHSILIGKDTRLSGYMIEYALAAGLTSAGANVYLTRPIPTAGVAYLTKSMRADAGIMVSASHNPYQDNGIKIFSGDGFKLPDQVEEQISEMFFSDQDLTSEVDENSIGKIKRIDDAKGRYIVYLKNNLAREINLRELNLGLDCANGAAYQVAPMVFDELGANIVTRGVSPSGTNINKSFGCLHPQVISKLVKDHKLDIGFAFDGDSDRLLVVDKSGEILSGDQLLALLARYYHEEGKLSKDTLVVTSMSNSALDIYLAKYGIKVERVGVGDRNVLEAMRAHGFNLGGEESGHIILLDDSTSGDGILSALKVLEILVRKHGNLHSLIKDFVPYPKILENIEVTKKTPLSEISGYQQKLNDIENRLAGEGRVFIRYSGTEDKLRLMVEAKNQEICQELVQDLKQFFLSHLI